MSRRTASHKGQFMPPPQIDPAKAEKSSPGTRLDAWKEIASYLRRGERTVKRWEVERGLPIHRVPGGARASVYAFTNELDEWLKSRRPSELEAADPAEAAECPEDVDAAGIDPAPAALPSSPVAPPAHPAQRRQSSIAMAVVLLVGLAVTVLTFAAPRNGGLRFSATLPSFFSRSQPKPRPAGALVVSDAERRLAHDLYLKGRYEWNQRTPDSLNRAVDSFTQSIVHDPGNARAYVGLADSYELLQIYSTLSPDDAYPRAIAAARKAVELDDSLAEAHRALAFGEFYGTWDFVDSEREFLRAIQLDPRDAITRRWYANAFAAPGRFTESLHQFDIAQELDPASPSTLSDKGIILFEAGKREEGMAMLKEVESTAPDFYSPHFYLMNIALINRDYRAYLAEGQKAAEILKDPGFLDMIAAARAGYARDGERGLLNALYVKQKEEYLEGKLLGGGTVLARTCILMGRKEEALQLLEQAYARHESSVLWCLGEPVLLTLKNEPRYQAILKKLNFPAAPASTVPGVAPTGDNAPIRASSDPS
jgi:tetratricopeptide (TPR) repeat protein